MLVVDDDEAVRVLLTRYLEMEGFSVDQVSDGGGALAAIASSKPDLILLDLMMPDVSGGRMFDEMRQHDATAGIPIVVVTGKPDAHEMFDDAIGPDNVVMKPFDADTLVARIRSHIGDPAD